MHIEMILIDVLLLIAMGLMIWPTVKGIIRWYLGGGKLLDRRMEKHIPVKLSARGKYRGRLGKN